MGKRIFVGHRSLSDPREWFGRQAGQGTRLVTRRLRRPASVYSKTGVCDDVLGLAFGTSCGTRTKNQAKSGVNGSSAARHLTANNLSNLSKNQQVRRKLWGCFTRRRSQVRVLSRPPFIARRYKQREELEGVVVTWIVT